MPDINHIDDLEENTISSQDDQTSLLIETNAKSIHKFLLKLYELFQWNVFERKDQLGINPEKKEKVLLHYARLTSRWISGQRLSRIILGRIYGYAQEGVRWDPNLRRNITYLDTKQQRNEVITEVMDEIENELKFILSNYITKFVNIYKTIKELPNKNTLADYIDYGTMNDVIIVFQKMGLSRELAKEIYALNLFEISNSGEYHIKNLEELYAKTKYKEEVNIISKNLRFIFI